MPDGVDAAVDAVQAPDAQAMFDCTGTEPERSQLKRRHNAVLTTGEHRDLAITWPL